MKKDTVSPPAEFYDVSENAEVEIKKGLGSMEVITTYACGASPLPPCVPPPRKPRIAAKNKKAYVIMDSEKKTVTVHIEATFGVSEWPS